jgi:hypothetical protein
MPAIRRCIKVIKSAEEMELIKRTARMQDLRHARVAAVEPGMHEADITAVAERHRLPARRRERHLSLCPGPIGTLPDQPAALPEPRHPRGRLRHA